VRLYACVFDIQELTPQLFVIFQLDATGLFQYIVPGAYTTVAGFVTLLAAAQALGSVKESIDPVRDKPIMFAFFQGVSLSTTLFTWCTCAN